MLETGASRRLEHPVDAGCDFSVCERIIENVSRVVVGKRPVVELLVVALLAEGHVLLDDVPGLGKTLIAKALAKSIGGSFRRVQFTPDLLPGDITGFTVYDQQSACFTFQPGPVVTNILLADEINRTIPRTQSSLLESMEERQVTVDGKTYSLPRPFFVVATQNPVEMEGTFPLPEAQMDRFLLRLRLGYPDRDEEMAILERFRETDPLVDLDAVTDPSQITALQRARRKIRISTPVRQYIVDLVRATRDHESLRFGSSPRGSLGLMRAGQAMAVLKGRDYVLPDDIKALALPLLAHRLLLNEEERLTGRGAEYFIECILDRTAVAIPSG
jgi:MoxR-like ATPase